MSILSKLFYLIVGILLALVLSRFKTIFDFSNNNSGFITLISILIAIFVFLLAYLSEKNKHYKNQRSILKTLKFKIKEVNAMLNSYREVTVPFYTLPIINDNFYFKNLDYKYEGKETSDLKFYINRIKDKCLIINLMLDKIRDSWNSFLITKKNYLNTSDNLEKLKKEYVRKDIIFKLYYPMIQSIINDYSDKKGLLPSINKSLSILTERFNIN